MLSVVSYVLPGSAGRTHADPSVPNPHPPIPNQIYSRSGINAHSMIYSKIPGNAAEKIVSRTYTTRTTVGSRPRYSPSPPHTPATCRLATLRLSNAGGEPITKLSPRAHLHEKDLMPWSVRGPRIPNLQFLSRFRHRLPLTYGPVRFVECLAFVRDRAGVQPFPYAHNGLSRL